MTEKNQAPEKVSYKDTLNLPRTDFPIRPNATVDDPAMIRRWQEEDLFHASFTHNEGREKFILHDGPPYANGHIHLGSAYNKILKDIVGKAKRMSGKHVPITPGWDCHGLPIELKVTQEFPDLSRNALLAQCRSYAQKWIDIQREEFKRLGILMDWDHPYLTMNPGYESKTLEALGIFVDKGYVEKKAKTVAWCASCKTVLATAEIEYKERKDPSILVTFDLSDGDVTELFPALKGQSVSLLIWTTTPWTLPLNRAVLLKPNASYVVLNIGDRYVIVGKDRADATSELLQVPKIIEAEIPAHAFKNKQVRHPFIQDLTVPVILDDSVSLNDGTACVHCAPGCGPDDYEVALKNGLAIYSPISISGKYTKDIQPKELEGMSVVDGQGWVINTLKENSALLYKGSINHSYPHCWRCRNGLIFRATRQWFINLEHENMKQKALEAVDSRAFLPKSSANYLRAIIKSRLEWCISRQRAWGVPIPALLCNGCDYALINKSLIDTVAREVAIHGIEWWHSAGIDTLTQETVVCPMCSSTDFRKEVDILDVWFDSGISHYAVLYHNPALQYPADLYMEGIDQHRGWFQSSLLTSLVIEDEPCMRTIIAHGYTVDEKGHKMSKSLGNVVAPDEIIQKMGTDGLRLWASSIDIGGDPVVSNVLLKNVAEVYRKIRNTARFLLSNLYDFDYEKDRIPLQDMLFIDLYALEMVYHLNVSVRIAYNNADFSAVFHNLADFCTTKMSQLYLDVIKDRLYCDKSDGLERRSAQTACWVILDVMTKLIAPVLSFTAEQISDHYQKNKTHSIHLQPFADLDDVWELVQEEKPSAGVYQPPVLDWYPYKAHVLESGEMVDIVAFHAERSKQWLWLLAIRSAILKAIEDKRASKKLTHSLEASVTLYFDLPEKGQQFLNRFMKKLKDSGQSIESFFKELLIVSEVSMVKSSKGLQQTDEPGVWVAINRAPGSKCPRCWQYHMDSASDLCDRCKAIIGK